LVDSIPERVVEPGSAPKRLRLLLKSLEYGHDWNAKVFTITKLLLRESNNTIFTQGKELFDICVCSSDELNSSQICQILL